MRIQRFGTLRILSTFLSLLFSLPSIAASGAIQDVAVSPPFFNPTVGQKATISFRTSVRGTARLLILDRDRFPIRALAPVAVEPGPVSITWDGRDDRSAVVPDEAWNIRIELGGEVYDPSLDFVPVSEDPQPRVYSRVSGVLSYRLSRPSRVHIEAGQAAMVDNRRSSEGPILKTIVNREPRVSGAVIERWNGFDDSGTIHVSALPDFVISVLATSLPDNSLITRGNHRQSFLAYARQHRPKSAVAAKSRPMSTHHHAGLNAFEDHSPGLDVKRTWTADGALQLQVRIASPDSEHFLKQPGQVMVYVDEKRVLLRKSPVSSPSPLTLSIPASDLDRGKRVVVNWDSDYGPGATAAFLVEAPKKSSRTEVGR